MEEKNDVNERLILVILVAFFVPTLIPSIRRAVSDWLLENRVLVTPSQALFEVPFMDAGLDMRRLAVLLVILVAGAYFARGRSARAETKKKEARRG